MAIQVVSLFAPTALTTSAATLYTAPTTPSSLIVGRGRVRFTNVDSVQHVVTAYAIPASGSAAVSNAFLLTEVVPANSHIDVDIPQLKPGGFIQALADAGSVVNAFSLDAVLFS